MIENTTDINQKVDEYLTLRALDVNTDMLEQAKISQAESEAGPVVGTIQELMAEDPVVREAVMDRMAQDCGVLNEENMTEDQRKCVDRTFKDMNK